MQRLQHKQPIQPCLPNTAQRSTLEQPAGTESAGHLAAGHSGNTPTAVARQCAQTRTATRRPVRCTAPVPPAAYSPAPAAGRQCSSERRALVREQATSIRGRHRAMGRTGPCCGASTPLALLAGICCHQPRLGTCCHQPQLGSCCQG